MDVMFEGKLSRFSVRKVERKDILGYAKRVGFDGDGQECPTALLTEDGSHILANGCTAEIYAPVQKLHPSVETAWDGNIHE